MVINKLKADANKHFIFYLYKLLAAQLPKNCDNELGWPAYNKSGRDPATVGMGLSLQQFHLDTDRGKPDLFMKSFQRSTRWFVNRWRVPTGHEVFVLVGRDSC